MSKTERIGIYPGTFDPITNGHIDIIQRALVVVDKLVIAVAADMPKTPIFSIDKRAELIDDHISELNRQKKRYFEDKNRIVIKTFQGLLVDFAAKHGATIIIRGLRAISDFEYEFMMSCMNSKLNNDIETVFLPASEDTQFISSRFVKEIARLGGSISSFVSKEVEDSLKNYYLKKN